MHSTFRWAAFGHHELSPVRKQEPHDLTKSDMCMVANGLCHLTTCRSSASRPSSQQTQFCPKPSAITPNMLLIGTNVILATTSIRLIASITTAKLPTGLSPRLLFWQFRNMSSTQFMLWDTTFHFILWMDSSGRYLVNVFVIM